MSREVERATSRRAVAAVHRTRTNGGEIGAPRRPPRQATTGPSRRAVRAGLPLSKRGRCQSSPIREGCRDQCVRAADPGGTRRRFALGCFTDGGARRRRHSRGREAAVAPLRETRACDSAGAAHPRRRRQRRGMSRAVPGSAHGGALARRLERTASLPWSRSRLSNRGVFPPGRAGRERRQGGGMHGRPALLAVVCAETSTAVGGRRWESNRSVVFTQR